MPNIKGPFNPTHIPLNIKITCFKCGLEITRGTFNHTFSPSKFIPPSDVATKRYGHKVCSTEPNFNGFKEQTPPPSAVKEPTPAPTTQDSPNELSHFEKIRAVMEATATGPITARKALEDTGWSVPNAIEHIRNNEAKTNVPVAPVAPKPQTQFMVEHCQVATLERLIDFRLDPRCRKKDINIYLGGAPGAGKSYSIKNLAKRLRTSTGSIGLEYAFIALSDATMPSAIFGYQQKDGDFCPTTFYRIYKNGGVLDIAELDNTNSNVFTLMNNALDNGSYFFPGRTKDEPDHEVKRHPDCIVIGNGNTFLRGGTPMFPGRQAQDAAAIERFKFINWKYDKKLENFLLTHTQDEIKAAVAAYVPAPITFPQVSYDAAKIASWLDVLGDKCETGDHENPKGHELVVSMRGKLNTLDCLDAGFTSMEALDMSIFKEYDKKSTLLRIHPLTF